jgi:hypothetical protein
MCNPGYDFICGKGFKIDVKSACTQTKIYSQLRGKYYDTQIWSFGIKRNKTADYFLCLAFDDRTNLTPLHIWLLPGEKFNHLRSVAIRESTLGKWAEFEQPLEKVLLCCSKMKQAVPIYLTEEHVLSIPS